MVSEVTGEIELIETDGTEAVIAIENRGGVAAVIGIANDAVEAINGASESSGMQTFA